MSLVKFSRVLSLSALAAFSFAFALECRIDPASATTSEAINSKPDASKAAAAPSSLPGMTVAGGCTIATPMFANIDAQLTASAVASANAGMNARGLGYFSPPRHFHTVEDDFKRTGKALSDGLDALTDLRVALDKMPDGTARDAITTYAQAYESAFHQVRSYAELAVSYERAVNRRNISEETSFSYGFSNAYRPQVWNTVGTIGANKEERAAKLTAQQAHQELEDDEDEVRSVERSLKLPRLHFTDACPALVSTD
jgi:hypothetical protein